MGRTIFSCAGKARFPSYELADQVRRRRRHGRKRSGRGHDVYRCEHCGGWHLGRSEPRAARGPSFSRCSRGRAIRDAGGSAWENVRDPAAYLRELTGE